MKKIRLNNLTISYKLVLLYLLISLPIITISVFFMEQSTRVSYDNMRDLSYVSTQQVAKGFEEQFSELYDISERILYESSVIKYVSTDFDDPYESYHTFVTTIKPILDMLTLFQSDVKIEIYSDNPMLMFSSSTSQDMNALRKREWFRGDSVSSQPTWLVEREDAYRVRKNTIGFYRMLALPQRRVGMSSYTMALSVTMTEEMAYGLLEQEAYSGRQIFICRNDGVILTGTDRDSIFATAEEEGLADLAAASAGSVEQQLNWNGERYLAIRYPLNVPEVGISNWCVLYLTPIRQATQKNASLLLYSLLICGLCMGISLLATYAVSRNILGRIKTLSATMRNAWNEKFNVRAEVTGTDEIGQLATNFNAMVQKIDLLREEVFQTSLKYHAAELQHNQVLLEKREAEISALSAQIHPHYLFNTLESIKMNLLVKRNIEETVDILDIFAENFRFFIDTSTDMVTLKEELYFLRNYTAIQRYSYGDKIRCSFSVSEELLDAKLPKLLLQPLVENAMYHGVVPKDGGEIGISIQPVEGGIMEICVSDNGIGMDAEALERINAALEAMQPLSRESGKRVALSNIYRRLKIVYGERASMRIESGPDTGTRVTIRIPRNGKEKE